MINPLLEGIARVGIRVKVAGQGDGVFVGYVFIKIRVEYRWYADTYRQTVICDMKVNKMEIRNIRITLDVSFRKNII